MIFIEQPAQVGFSYSTPIDGIYSSNSGDVTPLTNGSCPTNSSSGSLCGTYSSPNVNDTETSTAAAASGYWSALQGFMDAFPDYSREKFNFATGMRYCSRFPFCIGLMSFLESYGGHYAPVFSEYIEMQNAKRIPGTHEIHLNAVLIGNGWFNPLIQVSDIFKTRILLAYLDIANATTVPSLLQLHCVRWNP